MKPKAILWDIDGVVNKTTTYSSHLVATSQVSPSQMYDFFSGEFQEALVGKADLKHLLSHRLPSWGIAHTVEEHLHNWFTHEHKPDLEVLAHIERLSALGISQFAGTNQEQYRTNYLRHSMGLGKKFTRLFSSHELGVAKPHESFFLKILDHIHLTPSEVLFIDDTALHVQSAMHLGMRTALFVNNIQLTTILRSYFD